MKKQLLRRKEDKLQAAIRLQNTMRWAFVLLTKVNVFVIIIATIVFAAMMIHISLNIENINIKDLGEFAYNYWFGFGIFSPALAGVSGGAKFAQKFAEKKVNSITEMVETK